MNSVNVFVTFAFRYGNLNGHFYPVTISYNKDRASLFGKAEYYYRGSKYDPEIMSFKIKKKEKTLFMVYSWDDELQINLKVELFSNKTDALLNLKETKEEKKRDHVKLIEYDVDSDCFGEYDIQYLHSGWYFLNNREKEILRDIYAKWIFNN